MVKKLRGATYQGDWPRPSQKERAREPAVKIMKTLSHACARTAELHTAPLGHTIINIFVMCDLDDPLTKPPTIRPKSKPSSCDVDPCRTRARERLCHRIGYTP